MNKPDLTGLNQLDTAVILQKMILLNGMLNYGTPAEVEKAKVEFKKIEPQIKCALNLPALQQAKLELNISDEEIGLPNPLSLFE